MTLNNFEIGKKNNIENFEIYKEIEINKSERRIKSNGEIIEKKYKKIKIKISNKLKSSARIGLSGFIGGALITGIYVFCDFISNFKKIDLPQIIKPIPSIIFDEKENHVGNISKEMYLSLFTRPGDYTGSIEKEKYPHLFTQQEDKECKPNNNCNVSTSSSPISEIEHKISSKNKDSNKKITDDSLDDKIPNSAKPVNKEEPQNKEKKIKIEKKEIKYPFVDIISLARITPTKPETINFPELTEDKKLDEEDSNYDKRQTNIDDNPKFERTKLEPELVITKEKSEAISEKEIKVNKPKLDDTQLPIPTKESQKLKPIVFLKKTKKILEQNLKPKFNILTNFEYSQNNPFLSNYFLKKVLSGELLIPLDNLLSLDFSAKGSLSYQALNNIFSLHNEFSVGIGFNTQTKLEKIINKESQGLSLGIDFKLGTVNLYSSDKKYLFKPDFNAWYAQLNLEAGFGNEFVQILGYLNLPLNLFGYFDESFGRGDCEKLDFGLKLKSSVNQLPLDFIVNLDVEKQWYQEMSNLWSVKSKSGLIYNVNKNIKAGIYFILDYLKFENVDYQEKSLYAGFETNAIIKLGSFILIPSIAYNKEEKLKLGIVIGYQN